MEELELEIRGRPNAEWCIFYAFRWCYLVELRQGVELRSKAVNPNQLYYFRCRCPGMPKGLSMLIKTKLYINMHCSLQIKSTMLLIFIGIEEPHISGPCSKHYKTFFFFFSFYIFCSLNFSFKSKVYYRIPRDEVSIHMYIYLLMVVVASNTIFSFNKIICNRYIYLFSQMTYINIYHTL